VDLHVVICCSHESLRQELTDEQTSAVHVLAVAGPDDYQERGGQEVGKGLRARRPVHVRRCGGRELLPRVLRDARPQVRSAGGTAAAIRRQP